MNKRYIELQLKTINPEIGGANSLWFDAELKGVDIILGGSSGRRPVLVSLTPTGYTSVFL